MARTRIQLTRKEYTELVALLVGMSDEELYGRDKNDLASEFTAILGFRVQKGIITKALKNLGRKVRLCDREERESKREYNDERAARKSKEKASEEVPQQTAQAMLGTIKHLFSSMTTAVNLQDKKIAEHEMAIRELREAVFEPVVEDATPEFKLAAEA